MTDDKQHSAQDQCVESRSTLSPEERRSSLIHAASEPKTGRREPSEPVWLKERNKAMVQGIVLGLIVVAIAVAMIMVIAAMGN